MGHVKPTRGSDTVGVPSNHTLVDSLQKSRHWGTVYTNEVLLQWDWPIGSVSAQLEIKGIDSSVTVDFKEVTTSHVWRPFDAAISCEEDVFDLTLSFLGGDSSVMESLTAQLAVVTGSFGETLVNAVPSDKKWDHLESQAVIPFDAAWKLTTDAAPESRLIIAKEGGMSQTNIFHDASGYYGWQVAGGDWGYGIFHLTLGFWGTEDGWDATLMRIPGGTFIRMK